MDCERNRVTLPFELNLNWTGERTSVTLPFELNLNWTGERTSVTLPFKLNLNWIGEETANTKDQHIKSSATGRKQYIINEETENNT